MKDRDSRRSGFLISAAAIITLLVSPGCGRDGGGQAEWSSEARELYFGIPVTVSFTPADDKLAAKVWAYLEGVDAVFNDFKAGTEVSRINSTEGRSAMAVSSDMAEAIRLSGEVNRVSGGAFDITIGPLRGLWRGAAKTAKMPTDDEVAAALKSCGMDAVKLEGKSLSVTRPGVKLDFGGIIKGMAVDRAVAMLKLGGAKAALVQVGGETAAFGISKRGKPHVIGVKDPLNTGDIFAAVADPGTGMSAATSANYYNPVNIGGKEFYHIFDPRTGKPVSTRTLSVTIVFPETGRNGLADGLSTAGAVLGHEKARDLVEKLGGQALFMVMVDGEPKIFKTKGWDALVPPPSAPE